MRCSSIRGGDQSLGSIIEHHAGRFNGIRAPLSDSSPDYEGDLWRGCLVRVFHGEQHPGAQTGRLRFLRRQQQPDDYLALSGAAQAGQEQPVAANTTAATRETLRERDNAGLASDTS